MSKDVIMLRDLVFYHDDVTRSEYKLGSRQTFDDEFGDLALQTGWAKLAPKKIEPMGFEARETKPQSKRGRAKKALISNEK